VEQVTSTEGQEAVCKGCKDNIDCYMNNYDKSFKEIIDKKIPRRGNIQLNRWEWDLFDSCKLMEIFYGRKTCRVEGEVEHIMDDEQQE
jgi:hypothetical protein